MWLLPGRRAHAFSTNVVSSHGFEQAKFGDLATSLRAQHAGSTVRLEMLCEGGSGGLGAARMPKVLRVFRSAGEYSGTPQRSVGANGVPILPLRY